MWIGLPRSVCTPRSPRQSSSSSPAPRCTGCSRASSSEDSRLLCLDRPQGSVVSAFHHSLARPTRVGSAPLARLAPREGRVLVLSHVFYPCVPRASASHGPVAQRQGCSDKAAGTHVLPISRPPV